MFLKPQLLIKNCPIPSTGSKLNLNVDFIITWPYQFPNFGWKIQKLWKLQTTIKAIIFNASDCTAIIYGFYTLYVHTSFNQYNDFIELLLMWLQSQFIFSMFIMHKFWRVITIFNSIFDIIFWEVKWKSKKEKHLVITNNFNLMDF